MNNGTIVKQFKTIAEHDNFILTAPQKEVEEHLYQLIGKKAFNEYVKGLQEYESTLNNGTGSMQPKGILSFNGVGAG